LDFGENISFFAVYDGHGGAEVAEYCSLKLPEYLKNHEIFKSGNYEEALKQAFLGFDSTLLQDDVMEQLRAMSKKNPDYESSDCGDDSEDFDTLRKEGICYCYLFVFD
jgi:protein phosphatase 1G